MFRRFLSRSAAPGSSQHSDLALMDVALAAGVYLATTSVLFWPVVNAIGSVSIPTGDVYGNIWTLSWVVSHLATPSTLFAAGMHHPDPAALAYTEGLFAQALQAAPVVLLGAGPVGAYNFVWLLSHPLCGVAVFVLSRELGANRIGALLAGGAYSFSAYRLGSVVHLQTLSVQWLPLVLWMLLRFSRRPSWARALGVAAFTLLQVLSSGYYAALMSVSLVLCIPLLVRLDLGAWKRLATTLALGAAIAAPLFLPYWQLQRDLGLQRSRGEAVHWSARPASFLTPSARVVAPTSILLRRGFAERYALFPGLALFLLALVGVRRGVRGRERWWLIALAVGGGSLALGPEIRMLGGVVYGPFEMFRRLPGWGLLRTPVRMAPLFLTPLAVCVGLGWTVLAPRLRRTPRLLLLSFCVLELLPVGAWGQYGAIPTPPAWVDWMARADAGVVLELPVRQAGDAEALLWSLRHKHPLVNGWGAFASPSSGRLGAVGNRWPTAWCSRVMLRYGVSYVVVHTDRWPAARRQRLEGATLPRGVREEARFGPTLIYTISADGGIARQKDQEADPVFARLERERPGATSGRITRLD